MLALPTLWITGINSRDPVGRGDADAERRVRSVQGHDFKGNGAAGGTRTRNPEREGDPKSPAFTSFATAASWGVGRLSVPKTLSRPRPDQSHDSLAAACGNPDLRVSVNRSLRRASR